MDGLENTASTADLEERRDRVRAHPDPRYNGIDSVEVDPTDHTRVLVTFLRDAGDPVANTDHYGIGAEPTSVVISGGERIRGITVTGATVETNRRIELRLNRAGDLSPYRITVTHPQMDRVLGSRPFSFLAACPTDIDCETVEPEHHDATTVAVDYLARDELTLRRALFDFIESRGGSIDRRNPADMTVTLLEILADAGNRLSYHQDAVATESTLADARHRVSLRRHAQLVAYDIAEDRSAWLAAQFTVGRSVSIPARTPVITRQPGSLPITVADLDTTDVDGPIFETEHPLDAMVRWNEIYVHTWGLGDYWLEAGATEAYLYTDGTNDDAVRPQLSVGDHLIFEEVRDPNSGSVADADPTHRHLVEITAVRDTWDPVFDDRTQRDDLGRPTLMHGTKDPARTDLPLQWVQWASADALPRGLCISRSTATGRPIPGITVIRGNVALATHGRTVEAEMASTGPGTTRHREVALAEGPLTRVAPRRAGPDVRGTPIVTVEAANPLAPPDEYTHTPNANLLAAPPAASVFVAETDNDRRVRLRFGDGVYGRDPGPNRPLTIHYRVGAGDQGLIGNDVLHHLGGTFAAGDISNVRNPLPSWGAVRHETPDEIRLRAPRTFRYNQPRAVTADDYAEIARRNPRVQDAAARFVWTGSWRCVVVSVDPVDADAVTHSDDGHPMLASHLEAQLRRELDATRQAGYDVAVLPPDFMDLDITIEVCVDAAFPQPDVFEAVRVALSTGSDRTGRPHFFNPSRWTFGRRLYLSDLEATVDRIAGVESAAITRLREATTVDDTALERGWIDPGPWRIIRCANNPNYPGRGSLTIEGAS